MNDLISELRTLPELLRRRLVPLLPERAFLRRDRGDALFVTNAPLFADAAALSGMLSAQGFLCRISGSLMTVSPGPGLLLAQESLPAPDFLCASLERLRGRPVCEEAVSLFALGIRLLEHAAPDEPADYTRRVRRLAALCLRQNLGGAYSCALIAHVLNHGKETNP
jgi:hypothetical protein